MSFAARLGAASASAAPWVVIPTYNERENLPVLVDRLLVALDDRPAVRLLVVDDDSPDGTGRVADELALSHPEVDVLHRAGKEGLGAAYAAGFRRALEHGATHIVQMDADLSHDPDTVPDLLDAAERADLVLGSRYVVGGSTPDWPRLRRSLSRGGSFYARLVLGLSIRDLTGGFKCWRADALRRAIIEPPQLQGYGFQIELTYRALRAGCRVVEVPICFRDRRAGQSKMHARIVGEAMVGVPRLRSAPHRPRGGALVASPAPEGAAGAGA